jgi:hypothetical protein
MNYCNVDYKEYLVDYSLLKDLPDSQLEPNTRKVVRDISEATVYLKAMRDSGIDTGMLNLSNLHKEQITKAKKYL